MTIVKKQLSQIRSLGATIAIDDFGKGYSNLAYLRDIEIDCIKIDKSFIDGIGNNIKKEIVIKNIVEIAHELEIEVVAEGVEEEYQIMFLQSVGCENGQGYYWGKPSPIKVIYD